MDTPQAKDTACIRQTPGDIAQSLQPIMAVLAEKLARINDVRTHGDARYAGTRIRLEFTHVIDEANRWGDFARWNIVEDVKTEKVHIETRSHF